MPVYKDFRMPVLLALLAVIFSLVAAYGHVNRPADEPPWPETVAGFAFSPYRSGQSAMDKSELTAEQIGQDLRLIAQHAAAIRTYTVAGVMGDLPQLAKSSGLRLALGAWLGTDTQANAIEINRLLAVANAAPGNVDRLLVGNETLLRKDILPRDLLAQLDAVRAQTSIPVSTAEPWHVWLDYPQLADHVDFIAVHLLPYWEGVALDQAVDHAFGRYERLRQAFPDKPIVITEVGWPSQGRAIRMAQASPANQARFLRRFMHRADQVGIPFYLMEAFDQRWKEQLEGSVGSYWGVFDESRSPKFEFKGPVVPMPHWPWAVGGTVAVALLLSGVLLAGSHALRHAGRLFLVMCAFSLSWVGVHFVFDQSMLYQSAGSWCVMAVLLCGLLCMGMVFLVEAHEWAEALWPRYRKRPADAWLVNADSAQPTQSPYFVSIHMPVYAEPPDMVIDSLNALAALDYPHFEVIVIDNNTDDERLWKPVQAHCDLLGHRFRFFHVKPLAGFKAGALNEALRHTSAQADIVAVVDADYQVDAQWLSHLLPAFNKPSVAIVQAPQDYRDGHDNPFKTLCHAEYQGFFQVGMVTRNERNAIIQHGTMTLVRLGALRSAGGWGTGTVTEDAELGLSLFEAGHQAVYVNRSYGRGLTPDCFADYKTQRHRWAYGAMQILRGHAKYLLGLQASGLNAGQRYHFMAGWLPWIADGLNLVFTLLMLLWAGAMWVQPAVFDAPPLLVSVLPILFLSFRIAKQFVLYRVLLGTSFQTAWGSVLAGLSLSFTAGQAALTGLLLGRQIAFERTPKSAHARVDHPEVLLPDSACPDAAPSVSTQPFPIPPVSASAAHARPESILAAALLLACASLALTVDFDSRENIAFCLLLAVQSLPFLAAVVMDHSSRSAQRVRALLQAGIDPATVGQGPAVWKVLLAVMLLNGLLSFNAIWPTIAVMPQPRIAPEFAILLLMLSFFLALGARPSPRLIKWIAGLYGFLVLGRYVDVVVPNLLGRPVNLYWDLPQLPRFLWVTASDVSWWISLGVVICVWVLIRLAHLGLTGLLQTVVDGALPVVRRVWLWGIVLPLGTLACTHYAQEQISVSYLSKPVAPTYWRELTKLWDASFPDRVARLLPTSTVVEEALAKPAGQVLSGLNGHDMTLMFLETYGAVLYDLPEAQRATQQSRSALEQAIRDSGREVVSAFYKSPTTGGASDLAHMSVLSGIDLTDPRKHDVLLTTRRPTLMKVFQHAGYETFGLYHSVSWDWAERSYYGFDVYLSGLEMDYRGPALGFWKIPDQYAAAKIEQLHPRTGAARPRFTLFATISTHFPFNQVPPYQPDWQRLLGPEPFDAAAVARAQAEPVNWTHMRPDYYRTINYAHTWLAGYFSQPEPRESVYLMLGDHQPTGTVTGEEPSWDVPVFLVSRDKAILDRFRAIGFSDGLTPRRRPLGGLHDLTAHVLDGLGSSSSSH
jgi:exo-beta-1,3-glucanase (GH17 family)/cellulose synthase/poly-beta-1,6-N-acetylglucosamine synthase-like glycosyltransferase